MKFTDVFIRRPVLASVLSLLILLVGLRSLTLMPVRQYPQTENTVVTITTIYPGASSDLVKGFITTPLQQAIAEAEGIDYLSATSTQGISTIEAHMVLNYDPNDAVAQIQAKVASQRNQLPVEAEDPVIDSSTGQRTALMYLAFYSTSMTQPQVTDYLLRVVQPKLQAVLGVATADVFGNKVFAMRVWLDPNRMAAMGITADEVNEALQANNYQAAIGRTKGPLVSIDLQAETDLNREEEFQNLVIRSVNGALVRMRDVALTEMGAEDYDSTSWYKDVPAIFMGIQQAPGANPLSVAERIHELLPQIVSQLPAGLSMELPYDASVFIEDSIAEVIRTIVEAVLVVLVVIFLFLGSVRAAAVPAVAVPLSLIGGVFLMYLLGFSINLLTLLAAVLAIGLVVDDAIVVVENIYRHIQSGKSGFEAALIGARELRLPIIAMTTTLVAVYAPIGFMGGLTGALFVEFAFALAAMVLVSGVVALTLSPMLSSRLLRGGGAGWFEARVEKTSSAMAGRYRRLLHHSLNYVPVTMLFGVVVLASIYFMFITSRSELAPTEDQSILFLQARGPQTATIDYNTVYSEQIVQQFKSFPEFEESFLILGLGGQTSTVFGGFKLQPNDQRQRSQMDIEPELQQKLAQIAGFQTAVFANPSLPGEGGLPVQFVITSDADYQRLVEVADELIASGMQSGRFIFLDKSMDIDRPVATVVINRDLAGDLGVSMRDIGANLASMLGGGFINRFSLQGRSYKVIPQVEREFRLDPRMLEEYYVRSASGRLLPLSTLVSIERSVEPSQRTQFQQLNSITVQGVMAPGFTLGDALGFLSGVADERFSSEFSYDFAGTSRQFAQQGTALLVTFFLSVLVIYLVLAAQFESWRDPLIVLVSVPLSIAGAMAFVTLGFATVNIYTQVGMITLIGLIAKNGILIVQFANQLQEEENLDKREAVEKSAAIRLRPILMTTVSMLVAMVPLLLASGPGAVSRFQIGLVIATGLGIGTLFTLFVVPAVYLLLAKPRAQTPEDAEAAQTAAR